MELKHKLLLIEDLDGAENVLYPLRELQSKRRISKTVTLKDSKGNMKTITLDVEGPVCVSGCTTKEQLYEDNANRCVLLYMDNSPEQDKRIMDYQRKISVGLINQYEEKKVRERLKNIQRVLKPISVRNPFAIYLHLPDAVFKPRRTMMLLLLFTETITYYYQYQRELKIDTATGEQYIETTAEDITAAFSLLETTLLKKSDELPNACRSFFERLKTYLKAQQADSFFSREIRSAFRVSSSSLKRYLAELERMDHDKGLKCGRVNFRNLIRNPVYCGKIKLSPYKEEPATIVKGLYEAIVDIPLFESVQEMLDGKRKNYKRTYSVPQQLMLRGFLFCPLCKRKLLGSVNWTER